MLVQFGVRAADGGGIVVAGGLLLHGHRLEALFGAGQRRRVALLRALLAPYDLLLLDEPFKGLDAQTRLQVITYTQTALQTAAADSPTPKTVLLVTHSPEEATLLATQTLSLV